MVILEEEQCNAREGPTFFVLYQNELMPKDFSGRFSEMENFTKRFTYWYNVRLHRGYVERGLRSWNQRGKAEKDKRHPLFLSDGGIILS